MRTVYPGLYYTISTHDLTRRSTVQGTLFCLAAIISTHDLTRRSTITLAASDIAVLFQLTTSQGGRQRLRFNHIYSRQFQLTTSQGGRQQFLHKKFSFQNHFLCSLHIIHSYYINIAFFSTLFLQNLHFFWCESPRIFLFTCLSHSAF